jgi:hypothetical protein
MSNMLLTDLDILPAFRLRFYHVLAEPSFSVKIIINNLHFQAVGYFTELVKSRIEMMGFRAYHHVFVLINIFLLRRFSTSQLIGICE